jgi:hypothetical protein
VEDQGGHIVKSGSQLRQAGKGYVRFHGELENIGTVAKINDENVCVSRRTGKQTVAKINGKKFFLAKEKGIFQIPVNNTCDCATVSRVGKESFPFGLTRNSFLPLTKFDYGWISWCR